MNTFDHIEYRFYLLIIIIIFLFFLLFRVVDSYGNSWRLPFKIAKHTLVQQSFI